MSYNIDVLVWIFDVWTWNHSRKIEFITISKWFVSWPPYAFQYCLKLGRICFLYAIISSYVEILNLFTCLKYGQFKCDLYRTQDVYLPKLLRVFNLSFVQTFRYRNNPRGWLCSTYGDRFPFTSFFPTPPTLIPVTLKNVKYSYPKMRCYERLTLQVYVYFIAVLAVERIIS